MKRSSSLAIIVLWFATLPAHSQGSARPLNKLAIVGRLAAGSSPSYVAHLVRKRGIDFVADEEFVATIDRAGGSGVLINRLREATPGRGDLTAGISDPHLRQLAKCAEQERIGNFETAEIACRTAMMIDPQDPFAVLAVSRCREEQNDSIQAAALARDAVALNPELAEAHLALAQRIFGPESQREFAETIRLEPEELDALILWAPNAPGPTVNDVQRYQFETILNIEPEFSEAFALRARLEVNIGGSRERALTDMRRAEQLEPGLGERHLSTFYLLESMEPTYTQAPALLNDKIAALRQAVRATPGNHYYRDTLARTLEASKDFDGAIQEYNECLRLSPDDRTTTRELVMLYRNKDDFANAIRVIHQFLDVEPDDHDERYSLIDILIQTHQLETAQIETERFVQLFPVEAYGYAVMGEINLERGLVENAVGEYRIALNYMPDSESLHLQLAGSLARLNSFEEAIDEYHKILEGNEKCAQAHNDLAWLYATSADPRFRDAQAALEHAKRAVELLDNNSSRPERSAFLDTLAEAQLLNGLSADALKTEMQAVSLDPNNTLLKERLVRFHSRGTKSEGSGIN